MCTFAPPISGAQMCTSKKIIYITPNNENYIDEIILEYLNLWIELFPVSFHVNEKYFLEALGIRNLIPSPLFKKVGSATKMSRVVSLLFPNFLVNFVALPIPKPLPHARGRV